MASFPISLAFLALAPSVETQTPARPAHQPSVDTAVRSTSLGKAPLKILASSPPVPRLSLPQAVDTQGKVFDPVLPAVYEEPISAGDETRPSPQSPHRSNKLPTLSPAPSASPEPSA